MSDNAPRFAGNSDNCERSHETALMRGFFARAGIANETCGPACARLGLMQTSS